MYVYSVQAAQEAYFLPHKDTVFKRV